MKFFPGIFSFLQKYKICSPKTLHLLYIPQCQYRYIRRDLSRVLYIKLFNRKESRYKLFKKRNMDVNESEILGDQAMIFFVISALISFSRSIILGKVDYENGKIKLKELIKKIIDDLHINKAIKNYNCSNNENKWIPRAINWKMNKLLEFMCLRRAKQIISLRQNSH